jgi:septum formation protein
MRQLGLNFEIFVADIDETPYDDESPGALACRLATGKAAAVASAAGQGDGETLIVASDTVVAVDRQILGKPVDEGDAWRMLHLMRDRAHQVHTAICVLAVSTGSTSTRLNTTDVTMRNYGENEIAAYIATGDPLDKAGAYAIQHPDFAPVAALDGCFAGVMGFPLGDLRDLLAENGVKIEKSLPTVCGQHTTFACCRYRERVESTQRTIKETER